MSQTLLSTFIVLVAVFPISALGQGTMPLVDMTKEALARGQKVQQATAQAILTGQDHRHGEIQKKR